MFSLTPKGHENVSKKLSFGTWFGTQIGKMTILERIKKRIKKHIGNVAQMSPKGTTLSPGNRLKVLVFLALLLVFLALLLVFLALRLGFQN